MDFNGERKCASIANSNKTATIAKEVDEDGDPTKGGLHWPPMWLGLGERKLEAEKEKWEGAAAKMMEKFEVIIAKKKERIANGNEM